MPTDVTAASVTGLGSIPNYASGAFLSDGNATSITLGFTPRKVEIYNVEDAIAWTYMEGMASGVTKKETTGAMTSDNTGAILVGLDAGLQEPGASALLSAALCGTGKHIVWGAIG